jgi:DNA-binding transcriptional regulator of glucitol operon
MVVFLVLLVIAWTLQGVSSFWQARRFYGRIQQMRTLGRSAVGVAGSIYRTKAYGVLAVDKQNRIVRAEKLTGFTIFAQLRPVDLLVGHTLSDLLSGPVEGLSPKLYSAFKMAAEALMKEESATDTPEIAASEETGAPQPEVEHSGGGVAPDETREEVVTSGREGEKQAEAVT